MEKRRQNRKESIILTAIEIIDELGVKNLSIREIAVRQGITKSALYNHFQSKEDIIDAVFKYYTSFGSNIVMVLKEKNFMPVEAIIYYLSEYLEWLESYPPLTALINPYEILRYYPELNEYLGETVSNKQNVLMELIKQGQEKGVITSKFTAEELVMFLIGYLRTVVHIWRMDNCSFSVKEKVLEPFKKLLII